MDDDFSSLEAFADQFAGNWRFFPDFIWLRNDITDPEQWGIIYTRNSQSTPIEIVNAEHLKHLLWVYLHHKSKKRKQKHVYHIHDRHFAAGLTEGFLIRVYDTTGNVTNAYATLYDHLSALRDYPVADDEALDKLEAELFADEWQEILDSIIAHFDGEHHPIADGEYRYYVNLKLLDDISGIEKLILKHNPRDYWSSDTGYFNMSHFLYDITDGRITFDEIFFACPDTICLNFSAILLSQA
ncbi:MAG: hypothetical protein LUE17_17430 [Planctomycetaceae bacterium]|nr:hypothetical protein [Planctomycetaceae bacterium]